MMSRADRAAPAQAVNIAFYALAQLLEDAGVIDQDKLADEISRFDEGHSEIVRANLQGIIQTLRLRPLAPHTFRFDVIDGGKSDSDG